MRGLVFFFVLAIAPMAQASCGGDWVSWRAGVAKEARAQGVADAAIEAVLAKAQPNEAVLEADRSQAVFRQSFLEFSGRAVSDHRLKHGAIKARKHKAIFDRVEREFGIPRAVILAFWAMETDYGAVMGNIPTIEALATLAHDCRRPDLFRPQLIAAMKLVARGDFAVDETGAWAGEIGHVQMLPGDILARGLDGDGDGRVTIKTSVADAILSAANMLRDHGWRAGEPWLIEVSVPRTLDWALSGLDRPRPVRDWARLGVRGDLPEGKLKAVLLLPQGRKGPKFLAFENFSQVYLTWNKSSVNTITAAYLATRLNGAPPMDQGQSDPAFSGDQMQALQRRLQARGHDVGGVDGILGRMTRAAVRAEQSRLGLPVDGWPTAALFAKLK